MNKLKRVMNRNYIDTVDEEYVNEPIDGRKKTNVFKRIISKIFFFKIVLNKKPKKKESVTKYSENITKFLKSEKVVNMVKSHENKASSNLKDVLKNLENYIQYELSFPEGKNISRRYDTRRRKCGDNINDSEEYVVFNFSQGRCTDNDEGIIIELSTYDRSTSLSFTYEDSKSSANFRYYLDISDYCYNITFSCENRNNSENITYEIPLDMINYVDNIINIIYDKINKDILVEHNTIDISIKNDFRNFNEMYNEMENINLINSELNED